MKKMSCWLWIIPILACCGSPPLEIEKSMEEGVEVVLNHLKPYRLEGEPQELQISKLFSLDTADHVIIEAGLIDIDAFDVDAEGNIYLIRWQSRENFIFKFDGQGTFIKSFAPRGEGPGQFLFGSTVRVWGESTLMAQDPGLTKFQLFTLDGEFIREMETQQRFSILQLLRNGNFLIRWQDENMAEKQRIDHVGLANVLYERSAELDAFAWSPPEVAVRFVVPKGDLVCAASQDLIFVVHPERDYEIRVYDLEGALVRKIRKEYKPVRVTADFQESYLSQYPEDSLTRQKVAFRRYWHPCRYLITDDEGRLYVMTREEGVNANEAMYDVFNSEGVFITRTSLANLGPQSPLPARIRGGRLYCMTEKANGKKELIVYEMIWN